jgi:CubicO group peptidase (beta-lactamase class C family)
MQYREITLRHLLSHTAGLPAWRPLFLRGETPEEFLQALRDEPLEARPGRRVIYSDPGYMAAGEMVRRAAGAGLDQLFAELVARPLDLEATFRPGPGLRPRIAATEVGQACERELAGERAAGYRGWREGTIRGEVHDHHAWVAGGVLGSAGLFGTAEDVHRLSLECLDRGAGIFSGSVRERMRAQVSPPGEEARSEGFALNTGGAGSCGPALSDGAFGHTGFTGTSVWIDPGDHGVYVLLTNRVHAGQGNADMPALRREFHRLASELVR